MKITETRKAIIELIEPYMEKELDSLYLYIDKTNGEIEEYIKGQLLNPFNINNNKKVLGIYDITAVLKYIKSKGNYDIMYSNGFIINSKILEGGYYITYRLPDKSLHLYNEEEDKNLLDLLLKLK